MQAIIGSQFPDVVIPLIQAAKSSIKIIIFDWRYYPQQAGSTVEKFNKAISEAAQRGIEVKALVNTTATLDQLKKNKIDAKKLYTPKLLHAKMMLIDENILIIGSHNYTQNAFTMNHEISIVGEAGEAGPAILAYFKNLWPL